MIESAVPWIEAARVLALSTYKAAVPALVAVLWWRAQEFKVLVGHGQPWKEIAAHLARAVPAAICVTVAFCTLLPEQPNRTTHEYKTHKVEGDAWNAGAPWVAMNQESFSHPALIRVIDPFTQADQKAPSAEQQDSLSQRWVARNSRGGYQHGNRDVNECSIPLIGCQTFLHIHGAPLSIRGAESSAGDMQSDKGTEQ